MPKVINVASCLIQVLILRYAWLSTFIPQPAAQWDLVTSAHCTHQHSSNLLLHPLVNSHDNCNNIPSVRRCLSSLSCTSLFFILSLQMSNVTLSLSYVLSGFEMFERFNFNLSRGNNKTLKGKTLPDEKVYYFKFVWPWISVNFLIEMLFYLIRNPPCKYKFNVNVNWKGQSAPNNFVNRILKDYLKVP